MIVLTAVVSLQCFQIGFEGGSIKISSPVVYFELILEGYLNERLRPRKLWFLNLWLVHTEGFRLMWRNVFQCFCRCDWTAAVFSGSSVWRGSRWGRHRRHPLRSWQPPRKGSVDKGRTDVRWVCSQHQPKMNTFRLLHDAVCAWKWAMIYGKVFFRDGFKSTPSRRCI